MPEVSLTTGNRNTEIAVVSRRYKVIADYQAINVEAWETFVNGHPNGNFFQSPAFCHFISKTENYQAVAIALVEDDGTVAGILAGMLQKEKGIIKGRMSARLIVIGGPLVPETGKTEATLLIDTIVGKFSHKCIYFEFRNLFDLREHKEIFEKERFVYADHLNFKLATTSREQTIKNIKSTRNRFIRKSLRNNAKVITDVSAAQVKKFYSILQELYISKVGKPLPPLEFFEAFRQQPALGKYFLVEFNNEIVAGIMCPIFNKKCIYEWYIAGEDGKHDGIYPSTLATWAPIDYALDNGVECFDFMGAGKPGEDYGVREFKATFGGELVNHGRFTRINKPLLYLIGKVGIKILKTIR